MWACAISCLGNRPYIQSSGHPLLMIQCFHTGTQWSITCSISTCGNHSKWKCRTMQGSTCSLCVKMSFAPGQELWNYETQSVYGATGTPASLPFRETFDPEYKQTSPEIPNSPLYITTWNINKCKQNGSGEINRSLSPDISIFIVLFNHPLTQGPEFFAQKPSLQKCENIHRALTPHRNQEENSLLYSVLQCLLLTKLIITLAAKEKCLKLYSHRAGKEESILSWEVINW